MSAPPRRYNDRFQDRFPVTLEIASAAANFTRKFHKCTRDFVLEAVDYINVTGLAQDPANFFTIALKDGATVMASYSTQTGANGTIAADTFTTIPLTANLTALAGDVLSLVLTLAGTQTLPAGRLVFHGRYL